MASRLSLATLFCLLSWEAFSQELVSVKYPLSPQPQDGSVAYHPLVAEVLTQLEQMHQVSFFYSSELLEGKRINPKVLNLKDLEQGMQALMRTANLRYHKLEDNTYVLLQGAGQTSYPQQWLQEAPWSETIHSGTMHTGAFQEPVADLLLNGKVTSENGEALPGVTVLLKGTTVGTSTNSDGSYTLSVPDDSGNGTLVFSYIGHTPQEIPINNRREINVSLSVDSKSLDEVVVVGYGTQKKVNVTGAISMVDGEDLQQAPTTHVTNTLTGRVAGVIAVDRSGEPGSGGSQLFIRGQSTLGDNSPLIVVDGIPSLLGGLDKINPNDIESISVLKDASASIYGSRAANGVILVITKRGKSGKPTIDYSFNQGFVSPTRMPEMANAALYAQLTNEILGYAGNTPKFTPEDIQKFQDGSSPWTHPNTDWIDAVIKPFSLQNRHNLSLRGGGEKVRYFVSLGSVFEDAVYRNSATNYKQQNLRINLDADVTDNIRLTFDVQGRHSNKNYPPLEIVLK